MHELAIARSILEIALTTAGQHGNLPVQRVCLRVGAYRQILGESLHFAFAGLAMGTLAEDAVLEWEGVPLTLRCTNCGCGFESPHLLATCPSCGGPGGDILGGDELEVVTVSLAGPE